MAYWVDGVHPPAWPKLIAEKSTQPYTFSQLRERPSVLVITRAASTWDLKGLRAYATQYNWLGLPIAQIDYPQTQILPPNCRLQRRFEMTLDDPLMVPAWSAAREFCSNILYQLSFITRVSGIVSPHWEYWPDEAMRQAARILKVPFFVLFYEHFCAELDKVPPELYYNLANYSFKPRVDGVLVAGDRTRDVLINAGIFGDTPIVTTGWPRLDHWGKRNPFAVPKRDIVLLSYSDAGGGYMAPKNYKEVLKIFDGLSMRYPGHKFILRVKKDSEAAAAKEYTRGSNVIVDSEMSTHEVLDRAALVIGFNSMAMVEACLSRAALLIPEWGDADRPRHQQVIHRDNAGHFADFARTPEELTSYIVAAMSGPPLVEHLMEERVKFVKSLVSYDEKESASEKVQAFITKHRGHQ